VKGWGDVLTRAVAAVALLWGVGCCSSGACPASRSASDVGNWEAELGERPPLAINTATDISVKRDVHDVLIAAEASAYAASFQQVLQDPARRFGLIRIDRLRANVGKPFTLGEKFQGRYVVEDAVKQRLRGKLREWFGDFADHEEVQRWLCSIENQLTSDYGSISRLELAPPPGKDYVLEYTYLRGSPIAGSSTFYVSDISDPDTLAKYGVAHVVRLRQIFEYQELTSDFATFFTKGGLRLHDQVVFSQAEQAASAIGAPILDSDIPVAYRSF
jgi:hypothetical protein